MEHDDVQQLRGLIGNLAIMIQDLKVPVVSRTTERQEQMQLRQARNTEDIAQLFEAQKHTNERLNALIHVVDDLVRRDGPRP